MSEDRVATSIPAVINPVTLRWARETARCSIEDLAFVTSIPRMQLRKAEEESSVLSMTQLRKVAIVLERPMGFFYLNKIPDPPSGVYFRRVVIKFANLLCPHCGALLEGEYDDDIDAPIKCATCGKEFNVGVDITLTERGDG